MHWNPADGGGDGTGTGTTRRRRRWFGPAIFGLLAFLIVAIVASSFVTLPYYVIAPGSASPVDNLVRTSDRSKLYPHQGDVLFATVSEYKARPLDAVHSWFDHNIQLIPQQRILGNNKPQDLTKIDQQAMTDSRETAVVVALRRIGAKESGTGVVVQDVDQTSAAAAAGLKVGDVILSMDGKPTMIRSDVTTDITSHKPGDTGTVVVQSKNASGPRTITVRYGSVPADPDGRRAANPNKAFLGIGYETKDRRFDVPYTVSIDPGSVVGPSAGLAFTLELIDSLTPGELTGGQKIAVTGTIASDGSVGPVGGVAQKTAAVKAAGAKYFLVPPEELKEANAHKGKNLVVVPITSVDEALSFLATHGGDVSPLPPAGTTSAG
jgi:PDZ domain-containing protein